MCSFQDRSDATETPNMDRLSHIFRAFETNERVKTIIYICIFYIEIKSWFDFLKLNQKLWVLIFKNLTLFPIWTKFCRYPLRELTPYTYYQSFETERPLFFPAKKRKFLSSCPCGARRVTHAYAKDVSVCASAFKQKNTWQRRACAINIFENKHASIFIPRYLFYVNQELYCFTLIINVGKQVIWLYISGGWSFNSMRCCHVSTVNLRCFRKKSFFLTLLIFIEESSVLIPLHSSVNT